MSIKLRKYQARAVLDVVKSDDNVLVVAPAGSGKTYIMASIVKLLKKRTLIVVSRKEIRDQINRTLELFGCTDYEVSSSVSALNQIAKDSLIKPELLLIDEAHHSLSLSHVKLMKYLDVRVVGFTATPTRLQSYDWTHHFKRLVDVVDIPTLISQGYLAPTELLHIDGVFDASVLERTTTDYEQESMNKSLNLEKVIEVFDNYCGSPADEHCTLIYCPSVRVAKVIHAYLEELGYKGYCITGDSDDSIRSQVRTQFDYVCNVDVFTEGTDLPQVDTCLILRPTRSLSLYIQFAMRCMRPRQGKQARIIDVTDNAFRLGSPIAHRKWKMRERADETAREKKNRANTSVCKMCDNLNTFDEKGKCTNCGAQKYYCDNLTICHTTQTYDAHFCHCKSALFKSYDESHRSAIKKAKIKDETIARVMRNRYSKWTLDDVALYFDKSKSNPYATAFKVLKMLEYNDELLKDACKYSRYRNYLKWACGKEHKFGYKEMVRVGEKVFYTSSRMTKR